METGVVTIQEPVSTKTDVGGAPAGVILDKSSMEVHNINLSTVLDDEITSGDRRSNIVTGEADVVNGSGNKETEELEHEKGEATKTISVVDDSQIVNDDQDSFFIHEPQSFNKATEDENINLSDVTLEKKKEDAITGKPEEVSVENTVIEEDQTEAKHSLEQEEDTGNISKAHEDIPIKTEKVKEETDSSTVETSVNGTEAEHNTTVSVEEISRNGDNIVNETVPEDQTPTDGEPLHVVETTKTVLLEVNKEEEEEAEPLYKTVVEDANIVTNEETAAHESKILKEDNHQEEDAEPVEAIKNSEDAEQISREVTVDKQKEEDIIKNTEEVQESPRVIETPTKDHEDEMEKISKDTAEHEHLLVRDVPVPQGETLVTEAETADTPTVQEARILKTNINETEAVHSDEIGGEEEGQETKENKKPSKDLKDDKEQEETETVKTIISSDEVRSSDVQAEVYGEHSEPYNSEIKDESYGREESIELKSKETVSEKETAADGESVHGTTQRVLFEAEKEEDKEEIKINEEPKLNAIEKVGTETVKTTVEDPEIVNNVETTVHESESLKENAEPVEAVKNSDDVEKISREVTVDRGKEADITQKTEEIQERPSVIETSKIQGEDIESKASLEFEEEVDHSSKDTEEHEQVLERDVPQCETLEAESVETKEDTKPSLDLKEDKEKEETETVKTAFSSDEVRSSAVQEEEFGEHTEPCSSEIKDESHGREESVEVKSQETVQDENIEEKHEDLLDVPSTESEKYQDNESETVLVSNTESYEKSEESPSDLALNVDKEELNDEKINVDQVDGTQIMEEHKGLDSNGAEAEQIDRNRTDETEESPVAKPVALPNVESVEQMQKPTVESPSEVSEESIKTVDEKIEEKPEEVTVNQEESFLPNEKEKETKLEKHEPTNEEVKSDEVIEIPSALASKELEGETIVEAEEIENIKEYEQEQAADKDQKSLEIVETVESHSSLPPFSEEQEHGAVSEKIEDETAKEEEPMVQIKSEDDATKSHERQEEFSKDVETKETTVFHAEQTRDIEPSLTEKCSMDQSQPEEQEKKLSRKSENNVNETFALHSVEAAEEETAKNGESLHDVETTKGVLIEVEKDEEDAEIKTDSEPRLDAIEKEEIETVKTVVEDAKIDKNEEATVHESESLKGDDHLGENAESVEAIKNSDDAEQILSEVTGDREKEEDIAQKAEEVQEIPRVIETPTIQGEDIEPEASLDIKEDVDQSSKDTEQHEHVLERDIPQCETLEAEAVDTSTFQESAILKTLDTNISETEAVHSEMGGAEEGQETKEDTETSLDLKVGKEAETVKTVIFSDEVRPSDQVDVQAEEFGEHTKPCSSAIKDESQGREESVEVNSKEIVQNVSSEEKDVNLLDIRSEESEKYQENEPDISLVSKTESGDNFEEIPSTVEGAGLDETTQNQTLADVESVEKVHTPSLETPSELFEETSKTEDEKIKDKPKEEVTLHQEGQEEGSNGLETKEETVSVPESRELGEQAHEEELWLQNEQEKEVKLQKEQTKEGVSNDQQTPMGETSDQVIKVSSASLSEGPEDETLFEKIEGKKVDGEEQVADKIQKSLETVETVEPHSSLPSSSEEKEHKTVPEKTDGEKVKEAEPIGDMRERGLDFAETTHPSLPSVDQKEDIKAFDEEIQIPSVVTSTEKGETNKANETEDDKLDEHVDSSTSPMLSEKNDDETQTAEAEKEDEEITVSTSKTSELETPKPEESKEDKSQEISETIKEIEASDQTLPIETSHADNTLSSELVSEQDDQTPKKVVEIHEEEPKEAHEVEATSDRNLPVETSHVDNTPSSQLVSELDDQTLKQVDEIHEEETKEEHKLQAEEILPTEIIPRESSDEALASMLACREDDQVALQEDNCAADVRETKDIQEERSFSVETEESVGETKPKEPEDEIRDEHVETPTPPTILEENDSETLIAEANKGNEDINETERTMALESSSISRKSENVCIKQEDFVNHEAPKLEETKEEKGEEIPETAKAIETTIDQTPSLVSDKDDQTPKELEEILEEETKETHKVQAEPILSTETVPRESFIEAPVSMLASEEDKIVTPQEGDYAGKTQEEPHVSVETKSKESEAEGIEKSDDQVEDKSTKKTDVEVAELAKDNPTEEAEHGDETYSTLPVVGILTQLQTTLETERAINDSASSGENSVKEPADQEQKKSDVEVESTEKDSATGIIEAKMLQQDESGETEKIQEENGLAGKSLPIEEISLQEAKVRDGISREFEVNVEEKLQEETREIAECKEEIPEVLPGEKIVIPSSALPSEELEDVNSAEKQEEREPQQDVNASTSEKQEETHETVKEEDQIVEIIDEKKNEEVQDEKLKGLSATRDIEEIFSSEVKEDKQDASELGVGHDVVTPEVEKEEEPHSVLGNVEEINESVTSEKQITDPVGVINKASEAEHESHVETQAISDDTKSNNDRHFPTEQAPKDQSDEVSADESLTKEAVGEQLQVPSSTVLDDFQENSNTEAVTDLADRGLSVQNPSELIQSHQSPNQVEETSFEVEKAQEDKNEETVDTLITNVQVQDQPKEDFEAPAIEKEISEQEQKSNDLTDVQEDIGTYVKVQVPDDKLGDEDAIKDGVTVEEKNNTSENIDHEAAKEIYQEDSKQTDTVKEEIKEKEINQESFNNMKKTDDVIDKTQPEIPDIESLPSVSKTQDKPEQKDEVPNQQEREIAAEVPKLENPKIAEELQQKGGESENTKDLFSEVKDSEPTLKEPARKSLSDHIQKVKGTNKIEDATTEPHTEEEHKTEEDENDDEDHEHKDDKTSPDSIVMVEAKDTVSIIKTHKKSQGILSGVGSKVKQSISKVKKVLTGKSSHTTKPSSPK
ncbi:unnamed protein product [Arabidopsis halleri]